LGTHTLEDRGPIEGRARLRKPHLNVAAVIALGVTIVGLGYLGPHGTPGATPSPEPSAIAESATRPASRPPAPSLIAPPTPVGASALEALTGLDLVTPSKVVTSRLPLQTGGGSMGVVGKRLFYIVATDRIESSVIGSAAGPEIIVSVPGCQAIDRLEVAGDWLAYLVTQPAGVAATETHGCVGPGQVAWSLWLLDLRTGAPKEVARGGPFPTTLEVARFPIHLALTDSEYAFDRLTNPADPAQGTTIEVHDTSGKLLWTSNSKDGVANLMLGGSKLAVLTSTTASATGPFDLWVASAGQPLLRRIAQQVASVSLSPDGSYLAWDLTLTAGPSGESVVPDIAIEGMASGQIIFLFAPATAAFMDTTHPSIASTVRGPVIAWFATAPEGTVYPAFRFPGRSGGLLDTVQKPVWLDVDGSSLIWVAESPDGVSATAFAVDLTTVKPN
jgi:hypothetical protein